MADKDTVWTAVKAGYATDILIPLTNIMDRSVSAIDDTVGTAAAQQCIDYWALYAEVAFDVSDSVHLAIAVRGTIVVLMERGGVSSEMAQLEWDEVFGTNGLLGRLRKIGARGRQGPVTNSNLRQATGLVNGRRLVPWSQAYPLGTHPSDRVAP